ncbi:hypothetical protein AGR4C_Lc40107 [Agrobacterium tumefaciens str. Kerr 14]|uniref:Uncharacterized protein n=1 Tax=Agrobacterium tumefaciens str. Kerr 14 TaxID=1183424 RepID=A0A1S7RK54_AGRTU|nr:hypothetical protein AGR4C_Lc40107 [Agrobacterium tumefaciens str. Kerr 14]
MINEWVTSVHETLYMGEVAVLWPPSIVKRLPERRANQAGRTIHGHAGIAGFRGCGVAA